MTNEFRTLVRPVAALFVFMITIGPASAGDANRFRSLDENNPYQVSRRSPRLVTPQWVGESGVDAVVVLAIDDMRGPERWEKYLRPILDCLKELEGTAPVSIMTCQVDPQDTHLQTWLNEGLSLECHTVDHPCPLLRRGDFSAAKSTYDRCVDMLFEIPGNRPVAYRMPCCDSQNTVSPRFFSEIFAQDTPRSNFLSIDSSVFQLLTANDPELPRDLIVASDGTERFRKYLPFRSFVNYIEDYPYPYVIGRTCWEFPCMVPSDWEAQNVLQPANPAALEDMKAALDAVVIKQGVFNFVFHPYGWISTEQIAAFVRYAKSRYGTRVRFLTFHEALERLNAHALAGQAIRAADGADNGVRLLDLNEDGYLDVVIGNQHVQKSRIWSPETSEWVEIDFPTKLVTSEEDGATRDEGIRFGVVDGLPLAIVANETQRAVWQFKNGSWQPATHLLTGLSDDLHTVWRGQDAGVRLIDLDQDGNCELIAAGPRHSAIYRWANSAWHSSENGLPPEAHFVDSHGRDAGMRFVDIDDDLRLDLIYSNERVYGLYLQTSLDTPWQEIVAARRDNSNAIPMFSRQGTDNGAWFHDRQIWVQNEDTDRLPDLVDRRSIDELLDGVPALPKTPVAALASMRPRPGFRVELVAAEPLVRDPIAFDWGPDGRLWVVEMADYNEAERSAGTGRIRVLTDASGDGQYDQSQVFLEGLRYPTSVMSWKDGVLVLVPPALIFARDTNGDGIADEQEELFTGFAKGNPQHQANGLTWGLDNWIYGANGDSGGAVRSVAQSDEPVRISGRDFRLRIDTGAVEAVEGYTQFNRNRDDWNNWFGNANNNPMWQYVLSDRYLSRNVHVPAPDGKSDVSNRPGVAPVFPRSRLLERFNDPHTANHFTSACSAMVYRDDVLGPGLAGNSFVCEPVHNLVHREVMYTDDGIVWRSRRAADEQRSEFLASTDNWFRPTTVRTGPDGAIWIADMYRNVIEHTEWIPAEFRRGLNVLDGSDQGRIYRVVPVGRSLRVVPNLVTHSSVELTQLLESPNGWLRDKAQQILVERQDKLSIGPLQQLVRTAQSPTARLYALCTLDGLSAISLETLLVALEDEHPEVRRHAIRIAEPHFERSGELQSTVLKLVEDPALQVRLQLAYSLGEWSGEHVGRALGQLACLNADNQWIRAAAISAAVPHLPMMVDAVVHHSASTQNLSEFIGQLLEISAATGTNETLIRLIPALSVRDQQGYAEWQLAALADLIDLLARQDSNFAEFRQKATPELQASIDRVEQVFEFARAVATAQSASEPLRLNAIRLLGRGLNRQAEDADLLTSLISAEQPEAVRVAAIQSIGQLGRDDIPVLLLAAWRNYPPVTRSRVLDVLLSREPRTIALLSAIEAGQIPASEIDTTRRQQLIASRSSEIRERAQSLWSDNLDSDRAAVIESYREAGLDNGNPAQGEMRFKKHCAVCHRFNNYGFAVGPDLSALTDKSPEAFAIAVLDPNRAIESKFLNYTAVTNDGLTHTGLLASESGNSLTLRGQEDQQIVILRSDLETLESSGKSLMPDGFEKDLSPKDLADIIAYLRNSSARPKELAGNRPEIIRPEPLRRHLFLTATNAEIFGNSLRIEDSNVNLGWWAGEDDHAVWTIDIPRDIVYSVFLDIACDGASAGNEWLLECDGQRLTGKVESTGSWDTYRRLKVGELRLREGQHRLGLRANGPVAGALFDLRSITLIPSGRFAR